MDPVVLYRRGVVGDRGSDDEEIAAAREHMRVVHRRSEVPAGSLCIGRYSVLPYYGELQLDLADRGATLINTPAQHHYIADLRNWSEALEGLTPRSWYRLQDVPEGGPYVVKGATNSRKDRWTDLMFAATRADAIRVALRLQEDGLFRTQDIYVREYVPLEQLAEGIGGMPISREFRFFVCRGRVLCGAYYWASHADDLPVVPDPAEVPREFLRRVVDRVGDDAAFYALDVARTRSGGWIVVELNDGQMSGLSCLAPADLYRELAAALRG